MKAILKTLMQLLWVFLIFQLGNVLSRLIGHLIFIPGSIIGMLVLFAALLLKWIKLEELDKAGSIFLRHMGFFFIPLSVSLLLFTDILKEIWIQLLLLLLISNVLVMFVTSKTVELLANKNKKREGAK